MPYSFRRAPVPSLISGIKPSRFGASIPNKRTGATAAITFDGVGCGAAAVFADAGLYSAFKTGSPGPTPPVLARTASNSSAEITPLSFNKAAKRSRCSAGDAFTVINRASSVVSTPLVTNTCTSGSVVFGELSCASAGRIGASKIMKPRMKLGLERMVDSFAKQLLASACVAGESVKPGGASPRTKQQQSSKPVKRATVVETKESWQVARGSRYHDCCLLLRGLDDLRNFVPGAYAPGLCFHLLRRFNALLRPFRLRAPALPGGVSLVRTLLAGRDA